MGDPDWCEYSCIDATRGDTWYNDAERAEACTGADKDAIEITAAYDGSLWENCKIEQSEGACAQICASNDAPDDIKRQACKWQSGNVVNDMSVYYTGCMDNSDADWCRYACIASGLGKAAFTVPGRPEYACENQYWSDDTVNSGAMRA